MDGGTQAQPSANRFKILLCIKYFTVKLPINRVCRHADQDSSKEMLTCCILVLVKTASSTALAYRKSGSMCPNM